MARDDGRSDQQRDETNRERDTSGSDREKYRDGDDVRDPLGSDERLGAKPDTKAEARGDARENVGNVAHDRSGERGRQS